MNPDARPAVLLFAKAPEPGQVKTRLAPELGNGAAAVLAARLTLRALETAYEADVGPVELWCAPDTTHPFFDVCRRRHGVPLRAQSGTDIGVRMAHALRAALADHRAALLIGTDVPAMTAPDLRAAATALASDHDAVFGPAEDGGYWLVGLKAVDDALFVDLPWGTAQVLAATRERCAALGLRVAEVATRWDVDRPEDLTRLLADPATAALAAQLPRAA
ncbi:MAG: TIGR04282 family arsenosugar biosynthesis glycosyltransferase [Betaproteobacteria bacterium]